MHTDASHTPPRPVHQRYSGDLPAQPFELLVAEAGPPVGSPEFRTRMRAAGDVLRAAGTTDVVLVHGTFCGEDTLGLWGEVDRWWPAAARPLRRGTKRFFDLLLGEYGNWLPSYVTLLQESLSDGLDPDDSGFVRVRTWNWSSGNHHLARTEAAVELIAFLADLSRDGRGPRVGDGPTGSRRVQLWGHSHAGNVFALVSLLVGADRTFRDAVFDAAATHVRCPVLRRTDRPAWETARALLDADGRPWGDLRLDVATFGTPIRYAWQDDVFERLLHFVNHRPQSGRPVFRSGWPRGWADLQEGTAGDTIHQWGIAGSNLPPCPLFWRAWWSDRKLRRVVQPEAHSRWTRWPRNVGTGMRVAESGTTLLVDYGPARSWSPRQITGHHVYTQRKWLLFHAEAIAARCRPTTGIAARGATESNEG
jgi:hypothetical protein